MNYNFTDRVRTILAYAREEAIRLRHDYVGTEHILLGLIREGEGVGVAVLTRFSVDFGALRDRIEGSVQQGAATIALGELPYTSRAKKVLEFTMREAREFNHSYVGSEHLLLGILGEEGVAAEILHHFGVTLEETRRQTLILLAANPAADQAATTNPAGPRDATGNKKPTPPGAPEQIAEAFSRHNFEVASRYFADDIVWDMVGEEGLVGRANVYELCLQTADYLATVSTKFTRFRVVSDGETVVVDSTAEYAAEGLDTSVVASCDIYRFAGNRIVEITSYNIEIGQS